MWPSLSANLHHLFYALSFKEAIPFLDDQWLKIEMGDFSSWTEFENALTYLPFRFNNGTNVATCSPTGPPDSDAIFLPSVSHWQQFRQKLIGSSPNFEFLCDSSGWYLWRVLLQDARLCRSAADALRVSDANEGLLIKSGNIWSM